jgi:CheY-like chemotaxis protein
MKMIMVVDDEFDLLAVWRLLLEAEGYDVVTASNGAVALQLVRQARPDLIFSDCVMPIMTGPELCANLYQDFQLRDIPVILCSSASRIPPQANPIIAYQRKPVWPDALKSLLKKMLS